ncbi:MAG: RecB family exonuclease, partial [Mailhella sp.]
MKYELPRGYLSASSIGTLMTCPRQYEFRYIQNLVIPPNAALVTGSVMHKVFENYYKDAMEAKDGSRLTAEQASEMAGDIAHDYIAGNSEVKLSEGEQNDLYGSVRPLTKTYVDRVGRHIRPIGTEEEVRVTLPCGVDVLGYLDLRHELSHTEEERKRAEDTGEKLEEVGICDYKITGKKRTLPWLVNSLQFNLYTFMTGIRDVQIHNLIKVPYRPAPSRPTEEGVTDYASNLRVLHHTFSGEDDDHLNLLVESAARLITSGIFMPAPMDSWCCTPEWCGYWNLCRGAKRPVYSI